MTFMSEELVKALYFGLITYFFVVTISLLFIWNSFHEDDKKLFAKPGNVVVLVLIYLPVLIGIALKLRGMING